MIRFPDDLWFDEDAVINRVKNLWIQLLTCRSAWDLDPMKPYMSEALYQKEAEAVHADENVLRMTLAVRPAVLDSILEKGLSEPGKDKLVCRLFTRYTPRLVQKDTEKVISEGKETFFHEEWILARPEGVKTPKPGAAFSVNCPNCGAPFSLYKSAKCPMCRSLIPVPDFIWTVEEITRQEE